MRSLVRNHALNAGPLLINKFDEVNEKWLQPHKAEAWLYLSDSDYGSDWKLRLVEKDSEIIISDHLDPVILDGHSCYLIVVAVRNGFKRGIIEGHAQVAEKMAMNAVRAVYDNSGIPLYEMEPGLRRLVENKGLRSLSNKKD